MKQAKVTLTADIRGFKAAMKEAERAMQGVGKAAQGVGSGAGGGGSTGGGMGGLPPVGGGMGGAGGGGAGGNPMLNKMAGKLRGFVAGYLTFQAVKAGYQRELELADQRLAQRAVTQGADRVGEGSNLGFLRKDRLANAARFARAAGGINGGELTKMTNMGEGIERAYGVSQEQQSGFYGAARKAGARDPNQQMRIMSASIGAAVKAGLEGGQIGEYLQGMESYLSEMSDGVNIDASSLNGFAGALSQMPFFRSSPERAFSALRGMNEAFSGGDRFQQAQATRAILKSAPNSGAAGTEMRREMGLFGEINPQTLSKLKGMGVDTRALAVKPEQIIKNIFDEIKANTKDMSQQDQIYALAKRSGMNVSAAADVYAYGSAGQFGKAAKTAKNAMMTPEERLAEIYKNAEKEVKDLSATLDDLQTVIVDSLIPPLVTIANFLAKFVGGGKDAGSASFKGTFDEIASKTRVGSALVKGGVGGEGDVAKLLTRHADSLDKNTKATEANTKATGGTAPAPYFRQKIKGIGQ